MSKQPVITKPQLGTVRVGGLERGWAVTIQLPDGGTIAVTGTGTGTIHINEKAYAYIIDGGVSEYAL